MSTNTFDINNIIDADYEPTRKALKDFCIVPKFLSPDECTNFITMLEDSNNVERLDTRNRLMFHSQDLANVFWNRIQPYFDSMNVIDEFGDEWSAYGVNDRFRLVKYDENDEFSLHEDGYFYKDYDKRSFATYMVYLNDVPPENGGDTDFVDHAIKLHPQEGLCLTFLVDGIYHKGSRLTTGVKYILRTDIMYQCTKMKDESIRKQIYDMYVKLNSDCETCDTQNECKFHDKLGWNWFMLHNEYRDIIPQ